MDGIRLKQKNSEDKKIKESSCAISFRMGELAYYIYFAVMLLAKGIGLYEGMPLYNACLLFATGVLFIKLVMDSYSLKEAVCMAALVLLGVLIWRNSGEKGPFLYILMIIGMKNIPVNRVFKLGLFVWGSSFVIQMLLALSGIRPGAFMAHDKLGLGHIMRWSLGYPHPNVLHISYVILIAFLLYVLHLEGRKLVLATVLCFIGNLYIFMYSVSYTGVIFTVVYLVGHLYFNLRKHKTRLEEILIQLIFPACVLFAAGGPLLFKGKLFALCDKVLNTRFSLSKRGMTEGEWSLLGNRQSELRAADGNFTLDCSYTYLLMFGGMLIFAVMCIGYFFLIRKYVKEQRNSELAIIAGLLIAGISEPFLFNTSYKNLTLIFMGSYFFEMLAKADGKQLQILKWGEKTVTFSCGAVKGLLLRIRERMREKAKNTVLIATAAAILSGLFCAVTVSVPDSIYVPRKGSDLYEEVVYLDMEQLPEEFNSRVLGYVDKETPMYEFSGNIVKVEYIRAIVSSALAGGVLISGGYLLLGSMGKRKQKVMREDEA